MTFDLAKIREELSAAALDSPYSPALATAVVTDVLRDGGVRPPTVAAWSDLISGRAAPQGTKVDLRREQLAIWAHLLASSPSLRTATAERLRAAPPDLVELSLEGFFEAIAPLTAEMIRANVFRQEEALRRWAEAWGGEISGETPADSARRRDQLDYRRTLVEYEKAEKARADEVERRKAALKKAEEEEAAARGWRE